jgi:thymidylate synthase
MVYANFTEAYYDLIDRIYNNYEYKCSPRGQETREVLNVSFELADPRNRLPYIPERKFSLTYNTAEILWYLLGERSTAWIAYYGSAWSDISDDGTTANSAYGARIFRTHERVAGGRFTQWDYIISELKRDRDSRRAVVHIRVPNDSIDAVKDVPCTLSLQFLIRDDALHLIVDMRSNDIIYGLGNDLPAFTFMQELMAFELGVKVGRYMHNSHSLHVYEKHYGMCERILNGKQARECPPLPPIPSLPPKLDLDRFQYKTRMCHTEDELMTQLVAFEVSQQHDYWRDWGRIFAANRAGKLELKDLKRRLLDRTSFEGYRNFSI